MGSILPDGHRDLCELVLILPMKSTRTSPLKALHSWANACEDTGSVFINLRCSIFSHLLDNEEAASLKTIF